MVIDPSACFLWALLLLTLPLQWVLAAGLAAGFHELCHLSMLLLLGVKPRCLRIGPTGMQMDIPELPYGYELLCAAAGPMGSFLLLLLRHRFPQLAICGLIQGTFNLLPVYPLDGGRILRCFCYLVLPQPAANFVCKVASFLALATVFLLGCSLGYGKTLLVAALFLLLPPMIRKIPCKPRHLRVQ